MAQYGIGQPNPVENVFSEYIEKSASSTSLQQRADALKASGVVNSSRKV